MAEYLPSAPDLIFLTSDEHPCAQSVATGSGDSHRTTKVKNTSFSYFFSAEPLVSALGGATAPLYGIICRILSWNSRVFTGYEFDFI